MADNDTTQKTDAKQIDYDAARENSTIRRRNTTISYDVDLSVPAEQWPENFEDQQRLVNILVSDYHREAFGMTHIGFNPGMVSVSDFGDTVSVTAVVRA